VAFLGGPLVQANSEGVTGRHGDSVGMNTGDPEGAPISDGASVGMTMGPLQKKGSTLGGARAGIGTGEHGPLVGMATGVLNGALVWDGASIGTIMGVPGGARSNTLVGTAVLEHRDGTSDGTIMGGTEGVDALMDGTIDGMIAGGTEWADALTRLCKGAKEQRRFWERLSKGSWV
jgi:hypothetical protein